MTNKTTMTKTNTKKNTMKRQIPLESTFKEQSQRIVTFETFDQGDEGTLLDPKKTVTKTMTTTKTMTKTNTFREHLQRATLENCDL